VIINRDITRLFGKKKKTCKENQVYLYATLHTDIISSWQMSLAVKKNTLMQLN